MHRANNCAHSQCPRHQRSGNATRSQMCARTQKIFPRCKNILPKAHNPMTELKQQSMTPHPTQNTAHERLHSAPTALQEVLLHLVPSTDCRAARDGHNPYSALWTCARASSPEMPHPTPLLAQPGCHRERAQEEFCGASQLGRTSSGS